MGELKQCAINCQGHTQLQRSRRALTNTSMANTVMWRLQSKDDKGSEGLEVQTQHT